MRESSDSSGEFGTPKRVPRNKGRKLPGKKKLPKNPYLMNKRYTGTSHGVTGSF